MFRQCMYCRETMGKVGRNDNHSITSGICNTCFVLYQLRRYFKRSYKDGWTINLLIANDLDDMFVSRKGGEVK